MTTYDNLNIATTTLVFQGSGNTSVASGIFDLSSLAFLPNIPLIDQIEVERVFDTGYDTKFGSYSFTIANRREMFIFPKNWYSINEQTKVLTFKDLSTIPLYDDNGLYYPYSRSYDFPSGPNLDIPTVQAISTQVGAITRQADIVYIRRKTPSINSIVTFAPGTRLTTTQLNLQFDQLKFNIQELVAKFRNEAILKYDENAVDGPFLGQGDLKMNNNYIKDVNSPAFTLYNQNITDASGLNFSANTFLVNLGAVASGIINGTLHRTGLNSSPPVFSGDYDAGNLKLINLTNGSSAQDAATMGQISNASNITTGTLNPALFTNATIPLEKLSASRVTYTLPEAALPNANALSATTAYGSSTATNTNNIIYASVDPKGRITSVGHRNLTVDDLPTSGVNSTPTIYGASGKVPQITVDTKGRITVAADRTLAATDIPAVNATAITGALVAGNLPLVSGYSGTTATTNIPTSITVDTFGRVTAVASSGLTASNISDFNTVVRNNRLDQMAAPTASVSLNNQKILLLSDPTIATDAANKNYIDTNFTSTANLNAAVQANRLDQMTAPIAAVTLNNQKITNLGTPTLATDAATRGYVTGYAAPLSTFSADVTSVIQPNAVYWDSGNSVFTASRSSTRTKVRGVATPLDASDAVPLDYFTANALVSSSGVITAGGSRLTGLGTPAPGMALGSDAVNFALLESVVLTNAQASGQLVGSTLPQVYRSAAPTPTANNPATGWNRYAFAFVDGTNPLYATTSTMVIVEIEGSSVKCVPQTAAPTSGNVFNGWFYLDISGSTKTVYLYTNPAITGTNVIIRNFGLSRLVSGAAATTASTGLVAITSGNDGGISVTGLGYIALVPATAAQLGGLKLGTGLSAGSGGTVNVAFPTATNSALGQVFVPAVGTSGLNLNTSTGALSLPTATTTQLGGIKLGNTLSISSDVVNVVFPTATNSALGQVFVAAVATSGLSLDLATGALSLPTASTTQLGGVKIDTTAGLTNTSGLISVTRSDSTSSNSTTTLANSKAVSDLKGLSMLLDGTQTMTGKLKTFASTASVASLNVPIGSAVTSRTSGDIWNVSGNLQYSPDGTAIKTLAYLDSSITGNAATATALTPGGAITLSGAVTSSATTFTGSAISIATTLAAGQAVTAVTGAGANAITATRTIDSVALTLPQNIGTASDVQFNSARLGNITLSANTINTAATTGNLIIDSAGGTTTINDTVSIAGPLTVTGSNATTLGGAVTLGSTLALSNAPCTIALGNTAGAALTSINSAGSATGVNQIGDIILRTPANGRAFLVGNATNTTVTAANDAIITEGVLASRIAGLSSTYMSSNGATRSTTGDQILGVGTDTGSFIVKTGVTPVAKLTIANNGVATFANQLKVTTGGLQVIAGGLYVGATGTESNVINNGLLVQNGNVSCSADVTANIHLTSKLYVDTSFAKLAGSEANPSLTALWDSQAWIRAATAMGFHSYTANTNQVCNAGVTTIDATDFKVGVPHYCPLSNPGGGNVSITINLSVPYGYRVVLLYKNSSAASFLNAAWTVTGIYTDTRASFATMLTKRTAGGGTFSNWTFGTEFTSTTPGAPYTYQLANNASVSNGHTHDFIFMRIA